MRRHAVGSRLEADGEGIIVVLEVTFPLLF